MIKFILENTSWFWLTILIICVIIEAFSFMLTTIWAAIAALPMIFIAKTNLPFKWQLLIFVILTVLLLIFTRPFAIKKLKIGKNKTNIDALINQDVLVTKEVTEFEKGEGKTQNGVIWTVKSKDNASIKEGTKCKIVAVEGNTLIINNL
ncbi:MAG: NfeD family protein [Treponema sp.]|nr:NfeD family protein [Treponema sp.]